MLISDDFTAKDAGTTGVNRSTGTRTIYAAEPYSPNNRRTLGISLCYLLVARGQFFDFLGRVQVDRSQDHGRIQITRRDLHFRMIQLRVSVETISLDRLVVHFGGATSQELMVSD